MDSVPYLDGRIVISTSALIDKSVTVGNGSRIAEYVRIARHVRLGTHVRLYKGCNILEGAIIEHWVEIGYMATIFPGVRIGQGTKVLPHAMVTTDIADYAIVAGSPATIIGWG